MYAVTVTFTTHAGAMAAFLPLITENAALSLRDEPGCQQFDVCTDPSLPDTVFLYEIYADRAAFDAHLAMPHFIRFSAATAKLVAAKDVRHFARVIR